jgi:hypothetical protein
MIILEMIIIVLLLGLVYRTGVILDRIRDLDVDDEDAAT